MIDWGAHPVQQVILVYCLAFVWSDSTTLTLDYTTQIWKIVQCIEEIAQQIFWIVQHIGISNHIAWNVLSISLVNFSLICNPGTLHKMKPVILDNHWAFLTFFQKIF